MSQEVGDTRAHLRVELEAGLDEGDGLLGPKEIQPSVEDVQEENPPGIRTDSNMVRC